MYRAADEIEKEKELLVHERESSGTFAIALFVEFLLFVVEMGVSILIEYWGVLPRSMLVLTVLPASHHSFYGKCIWGIGLPEVFTPQCTRSPMLFARVSFVLL